MLSPNIHNVKIAAPVLPLTTRFLSQQETDSREILGELARGMVKPVSLEFPILSRNPALKQLCAVHDVSTTLSRA
jgi:hypothetical protein